MNLKKKQAKIRLTLMAGLPRSGKSTWAKKNSKNDIIICPDRIRKLIFGHQFHENAEDFIWAYAKGMAKLILEQGKNVIIDATNLHYNARREWYRIANNFCASIRVIWIKTSLRECYKRNQKSIKQEQLSRDRLYGMASIFENPVNDLKYCSFPIKILEFPYKSGYNKKGDNIYIEEILQKKRR
jgi:predicted kinase